jgi:hypothetical protein
VESVAFGSESLCQNLSLRNLYAQLTELPERKTKTIEPEREVVAPYSDPAEPWRDARSTLFSPISVHARIHFTSCLNMTAHLTFAPSFRTDAIAVI